VVNQSTPLLKWVAGYFDQLPTLSGATDYPYVLFPLTDYQPPISPKLITAIAKLITNQVNFKDTQVLVGSADRGSGPLIYAIAKKLNLPFALANWYSHETHGQVTVKNAKSWSGPGFICLNGIRSHQKVAIITDVLSTGGTLIALAQAVLQSQAEITQIVTVAENIDFHGCDKVEKYIHLRPQSLIKYRITDNKTRVLDL